MSNVFRVDFSKGIYGELEASIMPENHCAYVSNVIFESGSPRPCHAPLVAPNQTVWTGANTTTTQAPPAGTIQVFSYRNTFYFSSGSYRYYAAERYGAHDRIYYADGTNHKKIINGLSDDLGLPAPASQLAVTIANPVSIKAPRCTVLPGGGSLKAGNYAYRLYVTTGNFSNIGGSAGKGNAFFGPIQLVSVATDNSAVLVEWDSSLAAFSKVSVCGRFVPDIEPAFTTDGTVPESWLNPQYDYGKRVSPLYSANLSENSWKDDGKTAVPAKSQWMYVKPVVINATDDSVADFTQYCYTWVRNVNGHIDESGPSPVTAVNGYGIRSITRPAYNGPFTKTGTIASTSTTAVTIAKSTRGKRIIGVYDDPASDYTIITTDTSVTGHGLSNGTQIGIVYGDQADFTAPKAYKAIKDVTVSTYSALGKLSSAPTGSAVASTVFGQGRGATTAGAYGISPILGDPYTAFGGNITTQQDIPAQAGVTPITGYCFPSGMGPGIWNVSLTWPVVVGASGYNIYYSPDAGMTTWYKIAVVAASGSITGNEVYYDTGGPVLETLGAITATDNTATHTFKIKKGIIKKSDIQRRTAYYSTLGLEAYIVPTQEFTITVSTGLGAYTGLTTGSILDFSVPYPGVTTSGSTAGGLPTVAPFNLPTGSIGIKSIVGSVITCYGVAPEDAANTTTMAAINPISIPYGSVSTGNVTGWNIYKSEAGSGSLLAATVEIATSTWTDNTNIVDLTTPPDSFYLENGAYVIFAAPPSDLTGLCLHHGMLFGISGNNIRWTPVNRPDAWPEIFFVQMPSTPIALKSTPGSLLVFCLDGVYRINGTIPTDLKKTGTLATHGCTGSLTVQNTPIGFVYLSNDGLAVFNPYSNKSEKLVPHKLLKRFFYSPSVCTTNFPHWYIPARKTFAYAYLLRYFAEPKRAGMAAQIDNVVSVTGNIEYIRSFFHDGKYYLYYSGNSNYANHTILCVDVRHQDPIVSMLNFRPLDVHVNEFGFCYMLMPSVKVSGIDSDGTSTLASAVALENALVDVDTGFAAAVRNESVSYLFTWHPQTGNTASLFLNSGPIVINKPDVRKRWRKVEVHGRRSGQTAYIGCYADDVNLSTNGDGQITTSESPSRVRQYNLPRWSKGYNLRAEVSGQIDLIGLEIETVREPSES